jgi:thiol:disulfide interchange protein
VVDKTAGVVSPADFASFLENAKAKIAPNNAGTGSGNTASAVKPAPWSPLDPSKIGKGLPTLVDFTASWCVNCHAIEKQVFDDPSVKPVLGNGFVTMRADMTDWDGAPSQVLRKQYGIDALPAVLVFDAGGKEVKASRITGLLSAGEFLKRISAAEPHA